MLTLRSLTDIHVNTRGTYLHYTLCCIEGSTTILSHPGEIQFDYRLSTYNTVARLSGVCTTCWT